MSELLSVCTLAPSSPQGCKGCKGARVQGCNPAAQYSRQFTRKVPLYDAKVPLYDAKVPLYDAKVPLYNATVPLYDNTLTPSHPHTLTPLRPTVYPPGLHPYTLYTLHQRGCKGVNALKERDLRAIHTPLHPRIKSSRVRAKRKHQSIHD